jgi:cob(I)alamin adenosyltransferase
MGAIAMKLSKDWDEVCYPFIHEPSYLCDFEVTTDELCALIGSALAETPTEYADLQADLDRVQSLAFHINGSIRGTLAVAEDDLVWLKQRLQHYRAQGGAAAHAFVLPRGNAPVPQLHQCRSAAKKAVRCMVRVEQEGREVPAILPRACNLLCNLFFAMTLAVNQRRGVEEVPFESRSYKVRQPSSHAAAALAAR